MKLRSLLLASFSILAVLAVVIAAVVPSLAEQLRIKAVAKEIRELRAEIQTWQLHGDNRDAIDATLCRLEAKARSGGLNVSEVQIIREQLQTPQFWAWRVSEALDVQHLSASQLSPAEKRDARELVQRFLLGLYTQKVSTEVHDEVHRLLQNKSGQNLATLTPAELDSFLKAIATEVDKNSLPPLEQYEPTEAFTKS